ncbi:F390 synthetase-related protein [Maricaulis parjimensis]|uniref:F390 synthetase-related protein n=1 Tax=Maricaulis parjimensis TaxID=144023 RepID=UPI0019395A45|nr:F390 synthetase-related protein [Maricaulis parjimensis]
MSSVFAQTRIMAAYARARWQTARLKTRADVETWQEKRLERFLSGPVARVAAYRDMAGQPLNAFPLLDKAALVARYDGFNRMGLTCAQARHAWSEGISPKGYAIGASTGTSGNRGFYIVSDAERYAWLGTILGRGLPGFWRNRLKVAVMLPANSRLYDAANESRRLALRFFDLHDGVEAQAKAVEDWLPDVLVAPPKVLRLLAERRSDLAPRHVFSGAEVLDPKDRALVEGRFSTVVREIYMATEGLFAIACPAGTLHLLEDFIKFEWDPDPGGGNLRAPIITDFTRRTQTMVRYRMNDLLELQEEACSCGSPFTAVKAVVGRMDDVLRLIGQDRRAVLVTPDIIRNAVVDADARIDDFRVIQRADGQVELSLPRARAEALPAAREALVSLFYALGTRTRVEATACDLPPADSRKLRRVMRETA